MKTKIALVVLLGVMVAMTACGGGPSSTSPNQPSNPTITSVSVSCSPTSVQTNGTATCTASVDGTGSYSSVVAWSASAGTVDANGKFTAPANAGSVTITATSTEDATKSGKATITVTAPAVTVSIAPQTASVPSGGTQQFTASVLNTTNTAVTWSASSGMISNAGLLSLAGVAQETVLTVTATSVADPTKSAQAQVTVAQRQIAISVQFPTWSIPSLSYKSTGAMWVAATGLQAGDIASATFLGQTTTAPVTSAIASAGGFYWQFSFSLTTYAPGLVKITVASSDNTIQSNVIWIAVVTDMPVLVKDATTAYFNPGFQFSPQTYSLKTGANTGSTAGGGYSIAIDEKTGTILFGGSPVGWTIGRLLNGSWLSSVYDSDYPVALAAKGGFGYVLGSNLGQFSVSAANPVITLIPVGNEPWTIDAATVNNADAIAVYSKEDTTINLVNNTPAVQSFLPLTGITKASVVAANTAGTGGGWPIQIFGSGPAAGMVGFLSAPDKSLVAATIDGTNILHFANQLTLNSLPTKIAKDEANGTLILTNFDSVNGRFTLQSVDMKTFAVTDLTSSSQLPVGFDVAAVLVSSDGQTLYVAGIDATGNPAFFVLANK
jgi:hypothetical protein